MRAATEIFNERIAINGRDISNDDVVNAYEAVNKVDTGERKATFFEIATAMGFYYFAKKSVQWAVIETGMGGRFDATNIIKPKVSVITNLSIEHTDYLGNTIKALAKEKGGIIKACTPVVTGVSQPSGLKVIKKIAKEIVDAVSAAEVTVPATAPVCIVVAPVSAAPRPAARTGYPDSAP